MAELVYAHDLKSCLARDVGSTPTPGTFPLVAQLVEQLPLKETVVGSIPTERTRFLRRNKFICFCVGIERRRYIFV